MRTYKIYGTWGSAVNNIASIQFIRGGRIRCIRWALCVDSVTDNASAYAELSFQATSQMGTNDTIGVIDEVRVFNNLLTSGMVTSAENMQRYVDIPIAAGERIYLNGTASNASALATIFLDVEERG